MSARTDADHEAAFQRHLDRTVNYFAAIKDAGDPAWFEAGHPRRAEAVARFGLPEDVSEIDLRRVFFMRRYER